MPTKSIGVPILHEIVSEKNIENHSQNNCKAHSILFTYNQPYDTIGVFFIDLEATLFQLSTFLWPINKVSHRVKILSQVSPLVYDIFSHLSWLLTLESNVLLDKSFQLR